MAFSERFGDVPSENQALWQRDEANPIIRPGAGWSPEFIAPSSVLESDGRFTLFAEGGGSEREAIGAFACEDPRSAGSRWTPDPSNPILEPAATGFDRGSVFDPAVISFRGELWLYYSATGGGPHEFAERAPAGSEAPTEPEYVGAARSVGGEFERLPDPVLEGRCPAVIEWQDLLYMFYVKVARGGYRIHLAVSRDGLRFDSVQAEAVLDVGGAGAWDAYTVTTPKVVRDGDHFTMLYAGDSRRIDDPTGIGIAVSDDLVRWSKHPGNPVFATGPAGDFDSASVASAIPTAGPDGWMIFYGGSDLSIEEGLHSQIGRAWLPRA